MRFAWPCLLLLACSKGDDHAAAKPAAAGKVDQLKVAIDGKPVAIDRAFIKRASPDVFTLLLGAGKGSCEALLAGSDAGAGTTLSLAIARRVAATGHASYWITDAWSRDVDVALGGHVKADLAGTADKATTTKLRLQLDGKLSIRGEVDAVGCGELAPTGMGTPKSHHPSRATITVAGQRLDVRGVTVQTRPGVAATDLPNITISTSPKDCSAVTLPAPVILERIDTKWSLRGTWFEAPIAGDDAAAGLAFNANDVGKSPDGPTLELQLSGTGKVGAYQVELAGVAEAIECVR